MEKIKQFLEGKTGKNILMALIVILVALGSFELGRLSKAGDSPGVKILPAPAGEYPPNPDRSQVTNQSATAFSAVKPPATATVPAPLPTSKPIQVESKNFFASTRGSKYYPAGCSAGKSIKQENRVYFATREAAQAAGYTLSSSCR